MKSEFGRDIFSWGTRSLWPSQPSPLRTEVDGNIVQFLSDYGCKHTRQPQPMEFLTSLGFQLFQEGAPTVHKEWVFTL